MSDLGKVLLEGVSISPGVTTGCVRILERAEQVGNVREGDLAVVRDSSPALAVGVMNSAGLICERGGALAHICIVSVEMGIPCIARAEGATELLVEGSMVTLDATNGIVYASGAASGPDEQ